MPEEYEDADLQDYEAAAGSSGGPGGRQTEAYDSDEEGGGPRGMPGVQCAHQ